jgi:hypothetical protein
MTEALMKAVLLRRKRIDKSQPMLFDSLPEARKIERAWLDASEREKQSQTIFAQRALKPQEVIPEWQKSLKVLGGGSEETHKFLDAALARIAQPLQKAKHGFRFRLPTDAAQAAFRDRLAAGGIVEDLHISFEPGPEREFVHRTHPLVATTAEMLFERTLDPLSDPRDLATLARCGVWASKAVKKRTTIALLRLRHRLVPSDGKPALLAEEASAIAWTGNEKLTLAEEGEAALALLDAQAEADLEPNIVRQRLDVALMRLPEVTADLDGHATRRAEQLGLDHDRVRAATMRDRRTRAARVSVEPVTPVDIVGLYVIVPEIA